MCIKTLCVIRLSLLYIIQNGYKHYLLCAENITNCIRVLSYKIFLSL